MSSASFGTVNATGMNVTGILQATQVITTQPLQVSNITSTGTVIASNISASGTLGVTGAATLSNVTASGTLGVTGNATLSNISASGTLGVTGLATLSNVTASSGIINKNLVVSGSTISKNDFMYVDATMPIPSMILRDINYTLTEGLSYFDKDTKMIYLGHALFNDPVKRSEILYLNKYPFSSSTVSVQFIDFSLVDVCNSNGATLRSVSAGYDMRSLAATNEYVRWRANLATISLSTLTAGGITCQYAYWRMNMSGFYLDFINVQGGFETTGGLYWYTFINSDMRNLTNDITVQIKGATGVTSTANTVTLSKVGLYPDIGSPVNSYKFTAKYIIGEHHGLNTGVGRLMHNGHVWTTWLSNANELYEAMLNGDIWDTKYTNQEVVQGGPKLDNVDTANNYNLWNFGTKYSDANWNNYYSNTFITFVNTTRVTTGVDSNIYYPGPMSYGGLDNYLKIQLPTNNNCWGSSNLANATAFVSSFGTSIMPLRPVMKVTEGMSYYDWCECVAHLAHQNANDVHFTFKLFGKSTFNSTPYSETTLPLNQTGFIGSQFIANNGMMLVPYTFPSFYANKGTAQTVSGLFFGRSVNNCNKVGLSNYITGSNNLKSNVFSLVGKTAYRPTIAPSFVSNLNTVGFHYTDPVFYTDYSFGVISNALVSNNYNALSIFETYARTTGLVGDTSVRHGQLLANVTLSNIYKNSMEYILNTSYLGLSSQVNANNITVPYSSNLAQVLPYYTSNGSILYTGVQADVVPAIPDNAPDDFGPQYFGYYARDVSTGNAWNSTTWFNGMTTSLNTYKETLSNTCFIPVDFFALSSQYLFGKIDATQMATKTNSNVVVTSNVGWAALADGIGVPSGTSYSAGVAGAYPDGYHKPNPITTMGQNGFNLDTKQLRGLLMLKTLFATVYRSVTFVPKQYGSLNTCDLTGLCTTAIFDHLHNAMKCDSVIYDLRGFPGGTSSVNLGSAHNFANLATANTYIDIGNVSQDVDKYSSSNQKWTPSETFYLGRKLGFARETYRANPFRWFFQNDKYPTVTVYAPNDNVKIIKLADESTYSGGEREVTSEGFLTCGQVGNSKIILLCRNTGGATAANSGGSLNPTLASNILPTQQRTAGGIPNIIRSINGVLYANQGVEGLESNVLGNAGVSGVNLTYPGNYGNPALDAGLRTGWQDAGVDGSNVAAVQDFFVRGPDYIMPTSGPTLGNMKTQNWRDCDLERALLIDKNVSYANFSNLAYYNANKSLFNYIPY